MITNVDPDNGVAYGYISAAALDPEIVDRLMHGPQAVDESFEQHFAEQRAIELRALQENEKTYLHLDEDALREQLRDQWDCDDSIVEGEIDVVEGEAGVWPYEAVHYRSSWLGGALHFFILKSPFTTDRARRASPCVPNAGILDTLDGGETAYDVPPHWRA